MNEILLTQDQIINQQDYQLNTLGSTVDNLHSMSNNIRDELHTQGTLLSELENGIDNTQNKLLDQTPRIKALRKRRKTCKLMLTIFTLIFFLGFILYIILTN